MTSKGVERKILPSRDILLDSMFGGTLEAVQTHNPQLIEDKKKQYSQHYKIPIDSPLYNYKMSDIVNLTKTYTSEMSPLATDEMAT